jgi:NNP family nitrate/nitrite transporter-like MFS transporter
LLACTPLALPSGALGFQVGRWEFFALIELLGIGMGIGKASVYKYIPQYFPSDVGLVGGLVGTVGALGGFLLPLAFGYLDELTGTPRSSFGVMLALLVWSFAWLHLVIRALRQERGNAVEREQTARLRVAKEKHQGAAAQGELR